MTSYDLPLLSQLRRKLTRDKGRLVFIQPLSEEARNMIRFSFWLVFLPNNHDNSYLCRMTKLPLAILFSICVYACTEEKLKIIPEQPAVFDARDSFLGSFQVTDSLRTANTSDVVVNTYKFTVTRDSSIRDTIYFKDMHKSGRRFFALLKKRTFTIPSQKYISPFFIKGSGRFVTPDSIVYETFAYPYAWKGNGKK
jgi:hypothetical protein